MKNKVINFFTNYVVILIVIQIVVIYTFQNIYKIFSILDNLEFFNIILILFFIFFTHFLFRKIKIKYLRIFYFVIVSILFQYTYASFLNLIFSKPFFVDADEEPFVVNISIEKPMLFFIGLFLWGVYFNYLEKRFFKQKIFT